jgi:hypothetical protein
MSKTEISDEALESYLASCGDASVALQKGQRSENPHYDRPDPTRTYEDHTDAGRQYFKHGDASAIIAAE